MGCFRNVTDGEIGLSRDRHKLRIAGTAAQRRLQHFQSVCRAAQAQISRCEQALCIGRVGCSVGCPAQIVQRLIILLGAKLDLAGKQQARHVINPALERLLDRFASRGKVAASRRNERLEVVGLTIQLRYFSDGADLGGRLFEIVLADQQRSEEIATLEIIGLRVQRLHQEDSCRIGLAFGNEKPRLEQRRVRWRMRLREDRIDDLPGTLDVSTPGPQCRDAQKRICIIGFGGKCSVERGFCLLEVAERELGVADRSLERRFRVGTAKRCAAELGDQFLGVPVSDESARQCRQCRVRRIAQLQRHAQLFDRARGVAALGQGSPEQVSRFGVIRRFLQRIPELDQCSAGVALSQIVPRRFDQCFGRIAPAGGEQHDTEARGNPDVHQSVQPDSFHLGIAFVGRDAGTATGHLI